MSSRRVGKPSPKLLNDLLRDSDGKPSPRVLVGPGAGLDAAIIDMGHGEIMAVAEDPIFPAPGLPLEIMGRFTVHIGASDVAVTGVKPEFMTYTLLLPGSSPESDARLLIRSISQTARELGITIVGGHTGWYDAVNIPIVGGVTVWGTAPRDQWVSPAGSKKGDFLLMTKGPAIEAAALLAVLYKDRIKDQMGSELLSRLLARVDQITVVEDALTAFTAGGVHAMHDATEGGVLCGLWEMSAAAGLSVHVDLDRIVVPEEIRKLAEILQFDPWCAISEGTLLMAVEPGSLNRVEAALMEIGIEHFLLGRFVDGSEESTLRRGEKTTALPEPGVDPFWDLFFAGLEPG